MKYTCRETYGRTIDALELVRVCHATDVDQGVAGRNWHALERLQKNGDGKENEKHADEYPVGYRPFPRSQSSDASVCKCDAELDAKHGKIEKRLFDVGNANKPIDFRVSAVIDVFSQAAFGLRSDIKRQINNGTNL